MAQRSSLVNGKRKANCGHGSVTGNKTTRSGSQRTPAQKRADSKRRK